MKRVKNKIIYTPICKWWGTVIFEPHSPKCGPWASSINTNWELISKAEFPGDC